MAHVDENLQSLSKDDELEVVEFSNLSLEQCFKNIVDGLPLELDLDNLRDILRDDLQLNFSILKPRLKSVISYMLVHFIKTWPGWQRSSNYFNKQISYESWYTKFKKYLSYKLNYLIKNDFEKVMDLILKTSSPIDENVLFKIDNSTQTTSEKVIAPYSIEVTGFAKMLNTLVFCEGVEGNIIVNEYKANPFDARLTTRQLINWPYIEVEFISEELHFKRKNVHEFTRYLTFSTEKIPFKETSQLIEEVEIIDDKIRREAYTLNVLKQYCDMYVKVLRDVLVKHKRMLSKQEVIPYSVEDIKTILENFVLDVNEINMNSIATNTSVLFNIGSFVYARNKCVKTSDQAVSFAEFITPKINLSLLSFTAIKDANSANPFEKLQEISSTSDINLIREFLPKLKYNCTYCNRYYKNRLNVFQHFKQKHCTEQPVLCFKCKTQLSVTTLTAYRWRHKCVTAKKTQSAPR